MMPDCWFGYIGVSCQRVSLGAVCMRLLVASGWNMLKWGCAEDLPQAWFKELAPSKRRPWPRQDALSIFDWQSKQCMVWDVVIYCTGFNGCSHGSLKWSQLSWKGHLPGQLILDVFLLNLHKAIKSLIMITGGHVVLADCFVRSSWKKPCSMFRSGVLGDDPPEWDATKCYIPFEVLRHNCLSCRFHGMV